MKEKNLEKQKGITLIALVITITVLLILAGISIATITGNNGIIKNANKAKEQSEIATEQEVLETSVIQAMGKEKYGEFDEEQLKKELNNNLAEGNSVTTTKDKENIFVTFSDSKRMYVVKKNGNVRRTEWVKSKNEKGDATFSNGKITLTVGDYILYNPNSNGAFEYTVKSELTGVEGNDQVFKTENQENWRLFNIEYGDNEDQLILISGNSIKDINNTELALNGLYGYLNGETEINNICKIFGNGEGAVKATSITMEEIDKITGYDPLNTGDGSIYGEGTMGEYNNKITVVCDRTHHWVATGSNGVSAETDYAFRCNAEGIDTWENLALGKSYSYTSNFYRYNPITLTENNEGEQKGLNPNSNSYKMLFSQIGYWIANAYMFGGEHDAGILTCGICYMSSWGYFNDCTASGGALTGSGQGKIYHTYNYGVRPLVYLDKNISIKSTGRQVDGCNEWRIN